jgi:hypothetical protein
VPAYNRFVNAFAFLFNQRQMSAWKGKSAGVYSACVKNGEVEKDMDADELNEDDPLRAASPLPKSVNDIMTECTVPVNSEQVQRHRDSIASLLHCAWCGVGLKDDEGQKSLVHCSAMNFNGQPVRACTQSCVDTATMQCRGVGVRKTKYTELESADQPSHVSNDHRTVCTLADDDNVREKQLYYVDSMLFSAQQYAPSYAGLSGSAINDNGFVVLPEGANSSSIADQIKKHECASYSLQICASDPILSPPRFANPEVTEVVQMGLTTIIDRHQLDYIAPYYGNANTSKAVDSALTASTRLLDIPMFDNHVNGWVLDGAEHCVATYANDPAGDIFRSSESCLSFVNCRLVHHDSPLFSVERVMLLGLIPPGFVMLQAIQPIPSQSYLYVSYSERYWFERQMYVLLHPDIYQFTQLKKCIVSPLRELTNAHVITPSDTASSSDTPASSSSTRLCHLSPARLNCANEVHSSILTEVLEPSRRLAGLSVLNIMKLAPQADAARLEHLVGFSTAVALHQRHDRFQQLSALDEDEKKVLNATTFFPYTGRTLADAVTDSTTLSDDHKLYLAVHAETAFCGRVGSSVEGFFPSFISEAVTSAAEFAADSLDQQLLNSVIVAAHTQAEQFIKHVGQAGVNGTRFEDLQCWFECTLPQFAIVELFPGYTRVDQRRCFKSSQKLCRYDSSRKEIGQRDVNVIQQYLRCVSKTNDWCYFPSERLREATVKAKKSVSKKSKDEMKVNTRQKQPRLRFNDSDPWFEGHDDDGEPVDNWADTIFTRKALSDAETEVESNVFLTMMTKEVTLCVLYDNGLYTVEEPCSVEKLNKYHEIITVLGQQIDARPENLYAEHEEDKLVVKALARYLYAAVVYNGEDGDEYWPYMSPAPQVEVGEDGAPVERPFDSESSITEFMSAYIATHQSYVANEKKKRKSNIDI